MIKKSKNLINKRIGKIRKESSLYKTEPWGFKAKSEFYNQVLIVNTNLSPQEIMGEILRIELLFGRTRGAEKYSSRTLDIDILLFGDRTMKDVDLQIPHPRMHLRNFALVPLAEIAGEMIHPVLMKDIETLKSICKDSQKVEKVKDD
jgi:2-amino-4-hydroxy-6-hydroxymethyldihydropteridine diphosphokinase